MYSFEVTANGETLIGVAPKTSIRSAFFRLVCRSTAFRRFCRSLLLRCCNGSAITILSCVHIVDLVIVLLVVRPPSGAFRLYASSLPLVFPLSDADYGLKRDRVTWRRPTRSIEPTKHDTATALLRLRFCLSLCTAVRSSLSVFPPQNSRSSFGAPFGSFWLCSVPTLLATSVLRLVVPLL